MKIDTYIINNASHSIAQMLCNKLSKNNQVIALDRDKNTLENLYNSNENILIEVLDDTHIQLERIAKQIGQEESNVKALLHFPNQIGSLTSLQDTSEKEWNQNLSQNLSQLFYLDKVLLPIQIKCNSAVYYHLNTLTGSYWGPLAVSQAALETYIEMRASEEKIVIKGLYFPPLNIKERYITHPGYHNDSLPSATVLWKEYQKIFKKINQKNKKDIFIALKRNAL